MVPKIPKLIQPLFVLSPVPMPLATSRSVSRSFAQVADVSFIVHVLDFVLCPVLARSNRSTEVRPGPPEKPALKSLLRQHWEKMHRSGVLACRIECSYAL